jgi:hypothetical protein
MTADFITEVYCVCVTAATDLVGAPERRGGRSRSSANRGGPGGGDLLVPHQAPTRQGRGRECARSRGICGRRLVQSPAHDANGSNSRHERHAIGRP